MPKLLFSLILFLYASHCFSADINITLRKTDFDELKQQLIPQFEQKIVYLETMTDCLRSGADKKTCIEQLPIKDEPLKKKIAKGLLERDISAEQLADVLTELISEAKQARTCLIKTHSVNEVKDCAAKYQ